MPSLPTSFGAALSPKLGVTMEPLAAPPAQACSTAGHSPSLSLITAHFFPDKLQTLSFSFSLLVFLHPPLFFSVFIFVLVFLPSFHSLVIAVLGTLNW